MQTTETVHCKCGICGETFTLPKSFFDEPNTAIGVNFIHEIQHGPTKRDIKVSIYIEPRTDFDICNACARFAFLKAAEIERKQVRVTL